jgi:hypothetical protein
MTTEQYIAFFITLLLTVAKALAMKPCADRFPARETALFFSFWLFVVNLCLLPLYKDELAHDLLYAFPAFIYAVGKGALFYWYIKTSQQLSRHSGSSRAIVPVIAIGLIAVVNSQFLGEPLSFNQMLSAAVLMVFGLLYYFVGHLRETKSQKDFLLMIGLGTSLAIFDHMGLSQLHWFSFLLVNITVMMLLSFADNIKHYHCYRFLFTNKYLLLAAVLYIGFEVFITSTRVRILPVTVSNIAALMATPMVMLAMTIVWGESSLKKQGFFGLGAFALGALALL